VVRVLGYRSGGPALPDFLKEKKQQWVWNGVLTASRVKLRSYLIEK
jgi:hypothetical protein